jgi:hypothetical protein
MPRATGRVYVLLTGVVVLAATAVRAAGLSGDLWLDEVWSLSLAAAAASPLDVILTVRHDNNHWLNTLYLYALGPDRPAYAYRLLSFAAGVGAVVLAGVIGRRDGPLEGLLTAGLVGGSYLLIHYSSEARGYAPAAFFALAGFALLQRQVGDPRWGRAALFACVAVLGLLSHLTFLYVYAGLLAWTFAVLVRKGDGGPGGAALVAMHAVPLAAAVALYAVNVRHMDIGGGEVRPLAAVVWETVGVAVGLPGSPVAAAAVAAAAVGELVAARRDRPGEWVFFAVACLAGPAALLAAGRRDDHYPRYFLVAVPFVLLLLARVLARGFRAGGLIRLACAAAVLGSVAGNGVRVAEFLRHGRGHYRDALAYCLARTPPGRVITIGGDHDFRNRLVIDYHARSFPDRAIEYVPRDRWSDAEPVWAYIHDFDAKPRPADWVLGPNGRLYRYAATFRYSGLAGWNWHVYRLDPADRL